MDANAGYVFFFLKESADKSKRWIYTHGQKQAKKKKKLGD